ncbi:hypothetical protein V495_07244 [Pseudogymnoascus sp. VKM F-4514 (FW-929)]|nr:hypothetical protein V495_07244 [Pseudogymnoascus sp. VKM F-4514 (FW-929)]KFY60930.1 hypothetical protein V497_03238 [Pseudogymnoascus sp. VKM F-4516 (FW-969)]
MPVERKWGEDHINKSLRQINQDSWLIGNLVLHRAPNLSDAAIWNDDGDNSSYTLTEVPTPLPSATTPLDSLYIKLVHEAGDASAVWSIGNNAFCKVKYIESGVTPESAILNFVRAQQPSFETPRVLHHVFGTDRSYLFLRRVPGRTLDAAWPSLNAYWRSHYVKAVVGICKEMTQWKSPQFGGVDGQGIPERYLLKPSAPEDFSPPNLQAACEAMGMDCSHFVFSHADLGPTNIIVEDEPNSGRVGIIDFEIAGYFPRSWIRSKFRISGGMDLSRSASDEPHWWRAEVQRALGADAFEDVVDAWVKWARGHEQS